MGCSALDYFKCEPFELNFRLYVLGGFWPLETDVRWKKNLFSVFSFLCYFSMISMVVNQMVDIYLLKNDPVGLSRDMCTISMSFTIVTKSVLILYKVDLINYFKEKFSKYKNTRTDPADVEILENSNDRILLVIKSFYTLSLPCILVWLIFPSLDSTGKRVPFPYTLPIEWTHSVYVGLYVYQSLAMVGFMINTLCVDTMFCGFVLRINSHYDIIIKNIKSLGDLGDESPRAEGPEEEREEETKMAKRILRHNIELHNEVLRDIKIFEEIYSPSCVIHFSGIVTIIGTAIIDFIRVAKGFHLQLLQKMLYLSITLWDCFLYCSYATEMQHKSIELSNAAYAAHWYNMHPDIRKDLSFIILRSQNFPRVYVGHLFCLNLRTFVKILRISYDITALLYQTIKE